MLLTLSIFMIHLPTMSLDSGHPSEKKNALHEAALRIGRVFRRQDAAVAPPLSREPDSVYVGFADAHPRESDPAFSSFARKDANRSAASCHVNPDQSFLAYHFPSVFTGRSNATIVPAYSDPDAPIATYLARRAALSRAGQRRCKGVFGADPLNEFQKFHYFWCCNLPLHVLSAVSYLPMVVGSRWLSGFRRANQSVNKSLPPSLSLLRFLSTFFSKKDTPFY